MVCLRIRLYSPVTTTNIFVFVAWHAVLVELISRNLRSSKGFSVAKCHLLYVCMCLSNRCAAGQVAQIVGYFHSDSITIVCAKCIPGLLSLQWILLSPTNHCSPFQSILATSRFAGLPAVSSGWLRAEWGERYTTRFCKTISRASWLYSGIYDMFFHRCIISSLHRFCFHFVFQQVSVDHVACGMEVFNFVGSF